jgi:hypothetical protein
MSSSAPKVQDGAWRDAPVAERADAPVTAAASAGPSYVVTIEDDDKEEAKQRTKEEQGKKTKECCCCACCGFFCEGVTFVLDVLLSDGKIK